MSTAENLIFLGYEYKAFRKESSHLKIHNFIKSYIYDII